LSAASERRGAGPRKRLESATTEPIASPTPESPLAASRRLAPRAAELAADNERARRLAPDLVREIADAGLFRLCVPAAVGGLEAPPSVLLECVEALSGGDASAGWCVAIGATSGLLLGYLPESAGRDIYSRPEVILGGVFAPRGRAAPDSDGYRVSGRWPFASGCQHCDWLMGGCAVADGDGVRTLRSGAPDVTLMLAPASEVRIHDTWRVMGLRATGSHDMEFDQLRIPAQYSASVFSDPPIHPGPLYTFPLFGMLALAIAGVSLGVARGALDELVALAQGKTPTGSSRLLSERATVQADVARAEAALRAARGLLLDAVSAAWATARDQGEVPVAARGAIRLASTHAASVAAEVTAVAYRLGGGSALYESSPLQRRFRDANAATQHMLVSPPTWELSGRLLLGLETDTSQL
jgi:indole-3-acetate monooxygenase